LKTLRFQGFFFPTFCCNKMSSCKICSKNYNNFLTT